MSGGFQAFCQDHWEELIPLLENEEVNGLALQPLALEALWAHESIPENYPIDEGEKLDAQFVAGDASPICCYLEGRTRYSEDSEFEDDYEILIEMGTYPLDEEPDEWWVEKK